MDEQTKNTIKMHIELANSRMDDANDAANQSVTNGALMAAMSHLLHVVEQQQAVIEAQQVKIEELYNDLWEHVGDVAMHNERGYR